MKYDFKHFIRAIINVMIFDALLEDYSQRDYPGVKDRFDIRIWYIFRWYSPVCWLYLVLLILKYLVAGGKRQYVMPFNNMRERFSIWVRRFNMPDRTLNGYFPEAIPLPNRFGRWEYLLMHIYGKVVNKERL